MDSNTRPTPVVKRVDNFLKSILYVHPVLFVKQLDMPISLDAVEEDIDAYVYILYIIDDMPNLSILPGLGAGLSVRFDSRG